MGVELESEALRHATGGGLDEGSRQRHRRRIRRRLEYPYVLGDLSISWLVASTITPGRHVGSNVDLSISRLNYISPCLLRAPPQVGRSGGRACPPASAATTAPSRRGSPSRMQAHASKGIVEQFPLVRTPHIAWESITVKRRARDRVFPIDRSLVPWCGRLAAGTVARCDARGKNPRARDRAA